MPTAPASAASSRPAATPVRDRGDACPGTLRLHSADDGALARVRLPGGVLDACQADVLADIAVRLGDGDLHLTSRGNVQIRGLDPASAPELAALLDAAGLLPSARHERVRNIVASPLSGLDGETGPPVAGRGVGRAEVRPWLRALDALLCESESTTALSGRFLFALDDGRGDMTPLGADVTLRAVRGEPALRALPGEAPAVPGEPSGADGDALLRIGSHPVAVRVPARQAPRAALLAAEVFLDAARDSGAWRVAELPDTERQMERLTREVARRLDAAEEPYVTPMPPSGPPAPGIVSWRGGAGHGGGGHGSAGLAHAGHEGAGLAHAGHEGAGLVGGGPGEVAALSVVAPLGRLTSAQWRGLLDACREGAGEVRLTPWRGVVVPGLPPEAARTWLAALDALGLVTHAGSPWLGVTACVGTPGCAKSRADVRAEAASAATDLPTPGDPGTADALLPVHWSGCERRCGHPKGEWVDVVALPHGAGGDFEVARVGGDGSRDTPVTTNAKAKAPVTNGRTPAETLAVRRRPRIP